MISIEVILLKNELEGAFDAADGVEGGVAGELEHTHVAEGFARGLAVPDSESILRITAQQSESPMGRAAAAARHKGGRLLLRRCKRCHRRQIHTIQIPAAYVVRVAANGEAVARCIADHCAARGIASDACDFTTFPADTSGGAHTRSRAVVKVLRWCPLALC